MTNMTGMLWFDNDPKTALRAKIIAAADYFRKKYGQVPNYCEVNPQMLGDDDMQIGVLVVRSNRKITPGHLWIGVKEKEDD
jgi:hypothetical protein